MSHNLSHQICQKKPFTFYIVIHEPMENKAIFNLKQYRQHYDLLIHLAIQKLWNYMHWKVYEFFHHIFIICFILLAFLLATILSIPTLRWSSLINRATKVPNTKIEKITNVNILNYKIINEKKVYSVFLLIFKCTEMWLAALKLLKANVYKLTKSWKFMSCSVKFKWIKNKMQISYDILLQRKLFNHVLQKI